MEARAEQIAAGQAGELVWLVEHPPIYTAGVSAKPADLILPDRFPVFETGRGGQYTLSWPGQRVAYVTALTCASAAATCAPSSRLWRPG